VETTRSECLKYAIGLTGLLALALLYAGIWSLDSGMAPGILIVSSMAPAIWAACGLFCAGALLSGALFNRSRLAGSWLLCLFTTGGIFEILRLFPNSYGVLAFLLPILISAFLFDWKQMAVFFGLVVATSLYLDGVYFWRVFTPAQIVVPVLIVLAVSAFILLTIHPIFSVIDWYEKKYVTAHLNEQIIRANEVELQRLVRNLNDSQNYLRSTNDLLIKARDEAEQAKNVKQIFVQNVSHELRTPLNLIIGFSETMIHTPRIYGEVNWTPELRGDLECIFQNSQHLKALIDDVLDLAALENKKYQINIAEVDLNALINEVVMITELAYQSKGLSLETDLLEDRPLVIGDVVRLKQVLLNLLSNALKYTTTGGVTISARCADPMARVVVQDTGKGIPQEALGKLFEAFYQVDKSSNREDTGTGLGLTISKQLIELHGGELLISSLPGKGTTVTFTVPLA
jgi:signal transduction histidine kinase